MEQAPSDSTVTALPDAALPVPEGEGAMMTRFGFYKRRTEVCRVAIAYPKAEYDSRTVIVIGCGRGGTTAVSGVVDALGVRMVEASQPATRINMEDGEFVGAMLEDRPEPDAPRYPGLYRRIAKVIARRNAAYIDWGWKDPSADLYLEGVIHQVRNPLVLFVVRNIFDIGMSHLAAGGGSFETAFDQSLQRYQRDWQLAAKLGLPTLFIGYERALSDREAFVAQVIDFLRLTPSEEQFDAAVNWLRPKGGYHPLKNPAA
jgi:hypothetical protein